MKTEHQLITPQEAEHLLAHNAINRPMRNTRIRALLCAMEQGDWRLTHQGIAITGASLVSPGRLLDGQHRLSAIVQYGKPMMMTVSYGVDPDAFMVIDRGAGRTVSDVLSLTTAQVGTCSVFLHFQDRKLKPSTDDVLRVWKKLEPYYEMLVTTKAPRLCTAPVKAGFILKMIEASSHHARSMTAEMFTLLVNREYKQLPEVLCYLIKILDGTTIRGGGGSYTIKLATSTVRALDNVGSKFFRDNEEASKDVAKRFRLAIQL